MLLAAAIMQVHGGGPQPSAPVNEFIVLSLSVGLLLIALFLLRQSVLYHRWAAADIKDGPAAEAGEIFSWVVCTGILFGWLSFLYSHRDPVIFSALSLDDGDPISYWLFFTLKHDPGKFVPPLLVTSLVPGIVAIYKFAVSRSFLQEGEPENLAVIRSSSIGLVFSVLQILASIATLTMFIAFISRQ